MNDQDDISTRPQGPARPNVSLRKGGDLAAAPPPPFAPPVTGPAVAPPEPETDRPARATFPQLAASRPPAGPSGMAPVADAIPPAEDFPAPPASPGSSQRWRAGKATVAAAVGLLVVIALVVGLARRSGHPVVATQPPPAASGQSTPVSSGPASAPAAASTTAPPTSASVARPKPVTPMVAYRITAQVGPEPSVCSGSSFGSVQQFLAQAGGCTLVRHLFSGTVERRPVAISVAEIWLGPAQDSRAFISLITRNGTGDVRTLISDGYGYPGSPPAWSDDPTFLAVPDDRDGGIEVLEVMWADGRPTHEHDRLLETMLSRVARTIIASD